jgi:2-C-methyl-D-erythritol 4-phosphate cytidylyltransferase / 2-C-methyl-D-erythritol 2,4-cyclodiphosphate synthase
MSTAALIVAAGSGTRAGGDLPKQYRPIGGQPCLWWALKTFCDHPAIDVVQTVIAAGHEGLFTEATRGLDLLPPVTGGATRQDSCRAGLEALSSRGVQSVLIHDAARPFVSAGLLDRLLERLESGESAIPGLPVVDTLKRVEGRRISGTVDRTGLWAVQTPQAFPFGRILWAHRRAADLGLAGLTDDAAVAEAAGETMVIVPGDPANRKLTTPEDLDWADRMITARDLARLPDIRTGQGFDIHAVEPGDSVVLLGVRIPHDRRLKGHSDADAPMHALTDAILGALGEGDIGTHFPPAEPRWRQAPSRIFLEKAVSLVEARRGRIAHADVTILAEEPKIAPHIPQMKRVLSPILKVGPERIGIKATTLERLGSLGRQEGLAALAIATVRLPAEEP